VESPNRPKIPELDQLRGFAAILVFFYHSVHSGNSAIGNSGWLTSDFPLTSILYEGHTGVALFMVLSGFVLSMGTFDKDISYSGFIRNRALRIFPMLVVVLVFALYSTKDLDFGKIAAPFFLLMNTSAAFSDPAGLAGTVWTACVEFQFYLIAPILFVLVARRGILQFVLPAIAMFWLLRMIVLLPLHDNPAEMYRVSYFTIVGRIDQFLIGIALAYLVSAGHIRLNAGRHLWWIVLAAFSAGVFAFTYALNRGGGVYSWHWWRLVHPEIEGLLWAGFLAAYIATKPLRGGWIAKSAWAIGQISFSLYLLHYSMQREWWLILYPKYFAGMIDGIPGILAVSTLLLIPVLALSALTYWCIEKPFIDKRGKYLSAPRIRAQAVAAE